MSIFYRVTSGLGLFLLLFLLLGCETQRQTYPSHEAPQPEAKLAMESDEIQAEQELPPASRKLVYAGTLSLVVRQPVDTVLAGIAQMATQVDGYMASQTEGSITIRIPVHAYESVMDQISTLGRVETRYVSVNDVTDSYFDLEMRLDNARKARQTYLNLLEKAQNVSETLEVERELERLNGDIDQLEGRIRLLDNQLALTTISVYVREKIKPGPIGLIGVGLWKAVSWLFVRG
ncbi:MAG: DUF4349 domain-containing protein [Bacteroidia bacterium]|nr:DUF4349 domain-containing protein [Bacteroidia bacterium]